MKYYQEYGIHGLVKLANGTEIMLAEDTHYDRNGIYSARGVDDNGDEWKVEWEVLPDYEADGDEGDACDWEHPIHAYIELG